jgi:hypothetical protein
VATRRPIGLPGAAHNDIEEVERLARVKLSCGIEFANPR